MFILGYLIIFFAADVFLDNLKEICTIYGISPFISGALILGVDPEETIASVIAAINGLSYIALGNVIGNSIIALTLCFAIPAFFYKTEFKSIPQFYFTLLYTCMILALVGLLILSSLFIIGIVVLLLYFVYFYTNLKHISNIRSDNNKIESDKRIVNNILTKKSKPKTILLIILSFLFIILGGELLIISTEQIILLTHIPESFFGFVLIAFVTNVEELTLLIKSIKKHSVEIGLGGMIGKVFWNLAMTFGISALILLNIDFVWILLWNWVVLFVLVAYFNLIIKKKTLNWKNGVVLSLIFSIFLIINISSIMS
ncbi:MAG: hypothetical protein JW891_00410 [Candidatus Lokiarchaeota archaeon]|nr:hypothetical protein [Candidatus Lokiarchaeota archaeon]